MTVTALAARSQARVSSYPSSQSSKFPRKGSAIFASTPRQTVRTYVLENSKQDREKLVFMSICPLRDRETMERLSYNGVGAFIKPCLRLEFHYCDWGGSSRGMISFLKHNLPDLARSSPSVEIHVSPRPHKHPVIRAHYIGNGAASSKAICVRNMDRSEIQQKAVLLRDASGQKNRKLQGGRNVRSLNESVRGVWCGLHGDYQSGQGVWSKLRKKHMDTKNN